MMLNKRNSVHLPCTVLNSCISKHFIVTALDVSQEYKKSDGFFDVKDLYCGKSKVQIKSSMCWTKQEEGLWWTRDTSYICTYFYHRSYIQMFCFISRPFCLWRIVLVFSEQEAGWRLSVEDLENRQNYNTAENRTLILAWWELQLIHRLSHHGSCWVIITCNTVGGYQSFGEILQGILKMAAAC